MSDFLQLGYIGPGGPEFIVVMLVLLVLFGSKDAPRMLRKLNEIINQVRSTADQFKREVMYGDLHQSKPDYDASYESVATYDEDDGDDVCEFDEEDDSAVVVNDDAVVADEEDVEKHAE